MKQISVFVVVFFAIAISSAHAQDSTRAGRFNRNSPKSEKRQRMNALLKLEEEQDPAFKKHNIFGIKLASDGYGLSFEKGYYKGPKKALIFQAELNEKKHPKEEKSSAGANAIGQANTYIYGKANKNGVNVSALYAGGVSIGILKPYYVTMQNPSTRADEHITWQQFTDSISKYGAYGFESASGFTYGWNKAEIKPGVHAKLAMRFDYGHFNETVSAIEAGVNAEYYFDEIKQVVLNKNKHFFFNGYVTIMFGRRK